MKKIDKIIAICALLMGAGALNAQTTIYDANRWMGTDLSGTARFVGMGGAMGALGGDITTMGTNPAGIGIYRSNDFMVSFGFDNTGMKAANGAKADKFHGTFDNAGFVFASKIGNETALRFANFGFNYRKTKSFNKSMLVNGVFNTSQTVQMANMVNIAPNGAFDPFLESSLKSDGAYGNPDLPWLGILGYQAYLLNPVYGEPDKDGKIPFDGYFPYFQDGDAVTQSYRSKESGGIHSYDFNGALNFYDRFYIGATLGLYSVDYNRSSQYNEDFVDKNGNGHGGYTLGNEFWVNGSGVDFKLGFILRPIESSSFRIGAAIHTPTFYSLTEHNKAYINYDLGPETQGVTRPFDGNGRDTEGEYDYKLITPWKFNLSMGYTVGSSVALGLEYEYSNRTTGKLEEPNGGGEMWQTEDIKAMMKAVHTLRAGAEFKLAPEFAFRVGYNHISSPMKSDAFKYLQTNSMRTDTEYSNLGATNNYTFGIGYRGEMFYVDMAYMLNTYKETFYAFDSTALKGVELKGTDITNNNHKVLLTLGLRF